MSVWKCCNPKGKINPNAPVGTYNQFLVVPKGYNEGWIKIWKILNLIPSKKKITEQQQEEIINDINNRVLEEIEIAKYMIDTTSSEELSKIITTIKNLKKKEILTLKEIIKALNTYFVIQNSSENQKRRYAKYEPLKPLKYNDIKVGKKFNYGTKNNIVTIIDIHTDTKNECNGYIEPYYTVQFSDGNQRQTTLDKLTFI